jgi:hypothetical protein
LLQSKGKEGEERKGACRQDKDGDVNLNQGKSLTEVLCLTFKKSDWM